LCGGGGGGGGRAGGDRFILEIGRNRER